MKPLRIAVLLDRGCTLEAWEDALIARLASNRAFSFQGVQFVDSAYSDKESDVLARLLEIERKTLLRGHLTSPDGVVNRRDHAVKKNLPKADVFLSHCREGWPAIHSNSEAEFWGYDFLVRGECDTAGALEVARRTPTTSVQLIRKTGNATELLDCSITNTKICGALNNDYLKDKIAPIVERALVRRARGESLARTMGTPNATDTRPSLWQYSSSVCLALLKEIWGRFARVVGARPNEWSLFVGTGDILKCDFDGLTELAQPRTEFRADPFLFENEGQTFVFYEAAPYETGRGRLRVGRLQDGQLNDNIDLDLGDIHLSYPFVFRDAEEIYLLPETHQRDRVEVWRSTKFPSEWTLHATALEGLSPADSTLLQHGDDWWLFTNLASGRLGDHGQELHIFRTDGPGLTKLEPHADNPVVIDSTSARNGGRPFMRDGLLYRPAQITSHGIYGYGLKILEITDLTLDSYHEETRLCITPQPKSATTGCHHIDVTGQSFILDARRRFGSRFWGAGAIRLGASRNLDRKEP